MELVLTLSFSYDCWWIINVISVIAVFCLLTETTVVAVRSWTSCKVSSSFWLSFLLSPFHHWPLPSLCALISVLQPHNLLPQGVRYGLGNLKTIHCLGLLVKGLILMWTCNKRAVSSLYKLKYCMAVARMTKITNDSSNPVWHMMLYSCTHMAKG